MAIILKGPDIRDYADAKGNEIVGSPACSAGASIEFKGQLQSRLWRRIQVRRGDRLSPGQFVGDDGPFGLVSGPHHLGPGLRRVNGGQVL